MITATPQGGETYTMQSSNSDSLFAGGVQNAEISFGFLLADVEVTVTNMKYYDENDTLLYDQNHCYEPIGTKPVVNNVQAVIADTRDAIVVSWNSSELPDGDGRYVLQVRTGDDEEWQAVAETTDSSYIYYVEAAGTYEFRVGGKLGSEGEVTYCETIAKVENFLPALPTPVVTLDAGETSIRVSWTSSAGATRYEIYRYSSDEGPDGAVLVHTINAASGAANEMEWVDENVTQEVSYYYVTAYQYEEAGTTENKRAGRVPSGASGGTGKKRDRTVVYRQ